MLMERSIWLLSRDEILAWQERGGDDKFNIANNARGGQRSLSQITYVLSEKKGVRDTLNYYRQEQNLFYTVKKRGAT